MEGGSEGGVSSKLTSFVVALFPLRDVAAAPKIEKDCKPINFSISQIGAPFFAKIGSLSSMYPTYSHCRMRVQS